jgi:hypothetical protein
MKRFLILIYAFCLIHLLPSCKTDSSAGEVQMPVVSVKAEPLVSGIIENKISFNGSTVYLKKSQIISPIPGYVVRADVRFGQEVYKDMVLFELKTRESKALESDIDTSGVLGSIIIRANSDGLINELNINESGVYVAEGSLLCDIVNNKDLLIQVNIPFEYNQLLRVGTKCLVLLPDNTTFSALVTTIMPKVNVADQTQTVLLKPLTERGLPENLNLSVQFTLESHSGVLLVPRRAVLTNEKQTDFWLMKVINDTLAVNVPVKKGLESDSLVEIISPLVKENDLVIVEGAFELLDSSIVQIIK